MLGSSRSSSHVLKPRVCPYHTLCHNGTPSPCHLQFHSFQITEHSPCKVSESRVKCYSSFDYRNGLFFLRFNPQQAYKLYVQFASLLEAHGPCNNHLHTDNKDHEDTQCIPNKRHGREIQKMYSCNKETNVYRTGTNLSSSCILFAMDYLGLATRTTDHTYK